MRMQATSPDTASSSHSFVVEHRLNSLIASLGRTLALLLGDQLALLVALVLTAAAVLAALACDAKRSNVAVRSGLKLLAGPAHSRNREFIQLLHPAADPTAPSNTPLFFGILNTATNRASAALVLLAVVGKQVQSYPNGRGPTKICRVYNKEAKNLRRSEASRCQISN